MRAESAGSAPSVLPLSVYDTEPIGTFVVLWHPGLGAAERNGVRAALAEDFKGVVGAVPREALERLGGTRIVVNREFIDAEGVRKRGLATHRSAAWLTAHGFDAAREGVVEVYDVADYLHVRAGPQPMVLLHELTHVLAQHAGEATLAAISEAYGHAERSGRYDHVAHAENARSAQAYAMNNAGEYTAELSEAYFGRNDWFPFDRAELRAFDTAGCDAVARLWMVTEPDC